TAALDHDAELRHSESRSNGANYAPADRAARMLYSDLNWRGIGRALGLSARQLELARRIMRVQKLTTAGDELGVSIGTVKTYVQRLYQKLSVSSQLELALVVLNTHRELCAADDELDFEDVESPRMHLRPRRAGRR